MTGINGFEARLIEMFDSGAVFWLALLVALGVGAAHALAPGHGKTITAAYLVGTRGRYRDALRLGVIVALMHTLSVLVLAITWVGLTGWSGIGTERVTAWMQALAGLVVICVGTHLAYRHLRSGGGPDHSHPPHDHGHGHGHRHGHDHGHGHDHRHDHGHELGAERAPHGGVAVRSPARRLDRHHHQHDEVALTDPWSRRGLLAIGLSGGLLPSPSAFLVLVSGLLTGRSLDAVLLVGAFGVGLAGTLTAVGVVTIRGWTALAARTGRWVPLAKAVAWTPVAAGVVVAAGGALYLVMALGPITSG